MQLFTGLLYLTTCVLLSSLAECGLICYKTDECEVDDNEPWSYHGDNGPKEWGKIYPDCNGRSQSPVEIYTGEVVPARSLQKLELNNYDIPVAYAKIVNDGHSVQITPVDGVSRTVHVEGHVLTLQQLHFHWGSRHYQGSEHALDERKYAMEAHFVHTNARNEIAVVAVIFRATEHDNIALTPIVDVLPYIPHKNEEIGLRTLLNLQDLLPANPSSFYRYTGSLTTPGCTEGVVWSILRGLEPVGVHQLYEFRNLYSTSEDASAACKITDNFRPLQPLNERVIYVSQ